MSCDICDILKEVFSIIKERKKTLPKDSYCSKIFQEGLEKIKEKIKEESEELLNEIKQVFDKKRVVEEVVDLWFHTLLLLVYFDISLEDIFDEFRKRRR